MIEYRWGECCVGVTNKTILARFHMQSGHVLADCESVVVASLATTGDARVDGAEKARRGKTTDIGISVTGTAVIQGRNMIDGTAERNNTIVTGCAVIAVNADVIEGDTGKGVKDVRTVT